MFLFLLCLKIFFARILDVSLGTFRTVLTVKGKNPYASLIAFLEVFIWFLIAREVLNTDINSIFIPISYAGGFAAGTLIGGYISELFISGIISIEVTTKKDNTLLIQTLRENGFGVSVITLKKAYNKENKDLLIIHLNKKTQKKALKLVNTLDSSAFIVVNETKTVQNGFLK